MPSHDDLVSLAETLVDYLRQLIAAGMPPEHQTPLLLDLQEMLVWHEILHHTDPLPEREDWEDG